MALSLSITGRGRNPIPSRREYSRRLAAAFDQGIERAKEDFKKHGQHYTGGLVVEVERQPDQAEIYTSDQRMIWTALGTEPHVITARSGGSLAFGSSYAAKTTPSVIPSRAGGSSGNTVYATSVRHPGVEARGTHVAIADDVRPIFVAAVKGAVRGK